MTAPHIAPPRIAQRLLLASCILPFVLNGVAFGQERQEVDPNVTVRERPRPEYDPLGLRAGTFLIFPELGLREYYSDNVGFDEDNERSDFVTQIEPVIDIRSDWSRHSVGARLGGDFALHADESDEDYQDAFALTNGRFDVSRQTQIDANLDFRKAHENRNDPEAGNSIDLRNLFEFGGGLSVTHQFNRLSLTARGEAVRSDYEDQVDDDRNAWVYDALLRTTYDVSPRLDVFLEGRYNVENRDEDLDNNNLQRDSDGYEGRVGAALDFTSVLFGEAFVGYRVQQFDEPTFDDETGLSLGADVTWNPTQLTSIGLSGARDFRPTTQGNAASNFRTEFGLTIDHELLRNVIVGAEARYQNDDFRGIDRDDDTYIFGAGVTYWLNRNLSLNAAYDFSDRNSNVAGESFRANEISIGLTARL